MTKFRLSASGKLYHLIKLSMDRIESVPTSKKERIADHYELEEIQPETFQIMGHKKSESEAANKAKIKIIFKLILKNNNVTLLGIAITEWDDPGNPTLSQTWKELSIRLATTTDPQARIPQRYCGETTLELNSSYIQRGATNSKDVLLWFNHLSKLPTWAKETEYLKEARWIEEEIFNSITNNVIQMSKEIRLEEKRNDGNKREREIFPNEKECYCGIFEEHTKRILIKEFNSIIEEEEHRKKNKHNAIIHCKVHL